MSEFWRRWLMVAAGITSVAGLAFAGLAAVGAAEAINAILEVLYLPGALAASAGEGATFAIGVMGAVMAGWGATMLIVLADSDTASEPVVWRALTGGLLVWFVVDGIVTIAVGAPGNLVLSAAFVAMFAPALIATRPSRHRAKH